MARLVQVRENTNRQFDNKRIGTYPRSDDALFMSLLLEQVCGRCT